MARTWIPARRMSSANGRTWWDGSFQMKEVSGALKMLIIRKIHVCYDEDCELRIVGK